MQNANNPANNPVKTGAQTAVPGATLASVAPYLLPLLPFLMPQQTGSFKEGSGWDKTIKKLIQDKGMMPQQGAGDTGLQNALEGLMKFDPTLNPITNKDVAGELNLLGQMLSSGQLRQSRQFQQSQAAKTGGRLGSTSRGESDIAGQAALAASQGTAQIIADAKNRQLQQKKMELQSNLSLLQSYIQKYGIDKESELALKRLKMQQNALEAQAQGDALQSLVLLGFNLAG